MIRRTVDLPAPDGPRRERNSVVGQFEPASRIGCGGLASLKKPPSVAGQTEETLRQLNQDADTVASCCDITCLAYNRYTFHYNQSWRIIHATSVLHNNRTAVCCQYGLPFVRGAENTRGGKGKYVPFWYCEDIDACSALWVPAKVCEGSRNTTISDGDFLSVG
jgi:hypothetical protein